MCGSQDFRKLGMRLNCSQGWRPREASGIAVSVKQCRGCGLVFADPQPIPENLSDHYGIPPEDYWHSVPEWSPSAFSREIEIAKRLLPFRPGMTALDIGAGVGAAMRSLAYAGFDTWGIEPAKPFHRRAKEVVDPDRLRLQTLEEAKFPADTFDFITFGAVLEHLYSPSAALSKAMAWLRPGGIIHAEVPSSDWLMSRLINLYFRLRGTNYVTHISPMHTPFHLFEFTLKSFRNYTVAHHHIDVCSISGIPKVLQAPLRWWMNRTHTGMQLTVYLRK
jgi:2-polyprenyl-3-methyl-5-hydroxy-6-metoxy-1,4-benzoquinol methylase